MTTCGEFNIAVQQCTFASQATTIYIRGEGRHRSKVKVMHFSGRGIPINITVSNQPPTSRCPSGGGIDDVAWNLTCILSRVLGLLLTNNYVSKMTLNDVGPVASLEDGLPPVTPSRGVNTPD